LPRRSLAIVAALALMPCLAACGESEEEAYSKAFRPLNKRILDLGDQVGDAVNGASEKSDQEIEEEFGRIARSTADAARKVDALEPPDDLKRANDDLVGALRAARDDLRGIEKAADEHDADAARRATIKLVDDSKDVSTARRKLDRATRSSQ
jgi:hypothetical protein